MVCCTGCTFLIQLDTRRGSRCKGKETMKFIQKLHPVEMGLLPVAKTQHTMPRLMGGFANADARGLWDSCHHSAFEANMQNEKHSSSMSKNTYLYHLFNR